MGGEGEGVGRACLSRERGLAACDAVEERIAAAVGEGEFAGGLDAVDFVEAGDEGGLVLVRLGVDAGPDALRLARLLPLQPSDVRLRLGDLRSEHLDAGGHLRPLVLPHTLPQRLLTRQHFPLELAPGEEGFFLGVGGGAEEVVNQAGARAATLDVGEGGTELGEVAGVVGL